MKIGDIIMSWFAAVILFICLIVVVWAAMEAGYKNGQFDAKENRYKYGYTTNIDISANGTASTNIGWKQILK